MPEVVWNPRVVRNPRGVLSLCPAHGHQFVWLCLGTALDVMRSSCSAWCLPQGHCRLTIAASRRSSCHQQVRGEPAAVTMRHSSLFTTALQQMREAMLSSHTPRCYPATPGDQLAFCLGPSVQVPKNVHIHVERCGPASLRILAKPSNPLACSPGYTLV